MKNPNRNAGSAMSKHLITVQMNDTVKSAHETMQKNRVRHLPVKDESGSIIGVLSDRDVQRAVKGNGNSTIIEGAVVRDFMAWPIRSVEGQTDLRVVATMMIDEKISSVLVTKSGFVVGIVTTEDMLKVLLELLGDDGENIRYRLGDVLGESYWSEASV